MSLDIKYRPALFDDVLGQSSTIKILRQYVKTQTALRQSYIFVGPYGSGKTTLGRILARALLCESPTEAGDPCDKCGSCRSMLLQGNSVDFVEVDAASNSGKADMDKVIEEIQFHTFSGRRRIYLFDEAHRLSTAALDEMLKPLEESVPGSQDKRLICIFCTTEPEKMSKTILSRCAPAFVIRTVPPDKIAERMAHICTQEGIEFEEGVLNLLAEVTECHIRDAYKAIEGVSMLGALNKENVTAYLHLDMNAVLVEILEGLGQDLPRVLASAKGLLERSSPAMVYARLAELAMLTYQHHIKAVPTPPVFWDRDRLKALGAQHGEALLGFAARFSTRPGRPTGAMLSCDLAQLHHGGVLGGDAPVVVVQGRATSPASRPVTPEKAEKDEADPELSSPESETSDEKVASDDGMVQQKLPSLGAEGVRASEKAIGNPEVAETPVAEPANPTAGTLTPPEFCRLLALRVNEMDEGQRGPQGRADMDNPRTHPSG